MTESWDFKCGADIECDQTYPQMMKLWRICLVIVTSTFDCEREFSKLNAIKTNDRNKLCIDNLNMFKKNRFTFSIIKNCLEG